jgi:hypothetical protein
MGNRRSAAPTGENPREWARNNLSNQQDSTTDLSNGNSGFFADTPYLYDEPVPTDGFFPTPVPPGGYAVSPDEAGFIASTPVVYTAPVYVSSLARSGPETTLLIAALGVAAGWTIWRGWGRKQVRA